mmetsp:Transcript_18731/g.32732  ORF Transcript_18731/g.32732 Transcript_18731/m.32732 type:complete len:116 (-) Transcript_18731:1270-1617(-)
MHYTQDLFFVCVLAEAKTAVYGLQEQKKKNGRYFSLPLLLLVVLLSGKRWCDTLSFDWEVSSNPKAWYLVEKGSPNDPKYSVINISLDYIYAHTQWKVIIQDYLYYYLSVFHSSL